MGEATAGILDYANVRMADNSACKDIGLFYATTRSRRIDKGQAIDNVGIRPDISLSKDKNWIVEAMQFLDKK
jgi:C-terminal processing protease CtpA/Prc